MFTTEHLFVGRLVGTHGIRGEAKVLSNTDFPERRFAKDSQLILSHPEQDKQITVVVERSRPHKNVYLLKFVGWERIEDIDPWRNAKLLVPIADAALADLDDDEFYYHQVIGCQVQTTDGQVVGTIKEILPMPAGDVWVVMPTNGGKEILVPFVEQFVKQVDLDAQVVTIAWMEGLGPA